MKTILVTGSAKGIGASIIMEFAREGYNVVINYLSSKEEAMALYDDAVSLGARCMMVKADVSMEKEVDNMFKEIENTFGGVDILVNNAGVDYSELFEHQSVEDFRKTLDVNVLGAYITSRRAYRYMKENKWGRIINISSTNGIDTYFPPCLQYDASKAALNSLTQNLAIQFSPYITVNAVAPGFIGTEAELEGYDPDFLRDECEKILVKRYGKPEEVAHLVKFLASDDAAFINNSIIRIDGGQH